MLHWHRPQLLCKFEQKDVVNHMDLQFHMPLQDRNASSAPLSIQWHDLELSKSLLHASRDLFVVLENPSPRLEHFQCLWKRITYDQSPSNESIPCHYSQDFPNHR